MMKYLILSFFLPAALLSESHLHHSSRADGHAPIGVMADHTHDQDEVMFSYRYMFMNMDGNQTGGSSVSTADVLGDFMVSPTNMDMEMHMLGAMYAPNDDFTFMAMLPILNISMNHVTRMGGSFQTQSNGLGDIKLSTLYRIFTNNHSSLHLNAGISFPTGEIDEKDDLPLGPQLQLPYPMQLGSGTYDLMPGITYLGSCDDFSWGAQALGTIRLGENSNDYTLRDRFESSLWGAYAVNDNFSTSLRLNWNDWGNIDGSDPSLNPMLVPTANPSLRAGERLDLGIGINTIIPDGSLEGLRIAIEYLFPVYQHLDGPQLETDGILVTGIQMLF